MLWDPFLMKKVAEKCNLWVYEQYTEALFTEDLVNNCDLEKKKKGKRRKKKRGRANMQSKHSLNQTFQTFKIMTFINKLFLKSFDITLMRNIKNCQKN